MSTKEKKILRAQLKSLQQDEHRLIQEIANCKLKIMETQAIIQGANEALIQEIAMSKNRIVFYRAKLAALTSS